MAARPGTARRLENLASDLVERIAAPLGFWRRKRLVVERMDATLTGLGPAFDDYRIAFLTDLHSSPVVPGWFIARAVTTALALEPDLILLGGDFLSHGARYAAGLAELLRPLAAAGARELRNTNVVLRRGGNELGLAGVGDLRFDVIDFESAVAGIPPDVPRLVVSHDPDVFAFWPADIRLDLMLSGHTHGGQAHLPVLGPPYVPSQFGFRYLAGQVREGERQLYVSRGIGAITAPFRWGCPPELTLVVLHPPS